MDTVGKIFGMIRKNRESGTQERPPARSNNVKGKSTNFRPANQAQSIKKETAANPNPAPSIQKKWVIKKDSANSEQTNQAPLVIKETPNSAGTSNQPQVVKKRAENAEENSTAQKNYMRKTQSFSAKEKGKAKVEEEAEEAVKRQKREAAEVRPKHHLRWDPTRLNEVDVEEHGICIICERDLSSLSDNDDIGYSDEEDNYGYQVEMKKLPEIGVLGCGHCYHDECLDSITPQDLTADPPCLICLS